MYTIRYTNFIKTWYSVLHPKDVGCGLLLYDWILSPDNT